MSEADDWQSRIKAIGRIDGLDYYSYAKTEKLKVGTLLFCRRKQRKFRTRYIVMEVTSEWGSVQATNAEIIYRKSKRRWVVQLDNVPVNDGYTTLLSAKTSCLKHPLDRLAAEAELTP
jgi:hypothetical protein